MRVQLALNVQNLGVEVFADADVRATTDCLKAADLVDSVEDEQTCCYATQNKLWALDPQGMRWEYYRVVEDAANFGNGGDFEEPAQPAASGCC